MPVKANYRFDPEQKSETKTVRTSDTDTSLRIRGSGVRTSLGATTSFKPWEGSHRASQVPTASARQFGQDIASIQRLGSRSQPLGAGGRTAPAAIVDPQLQNLQQRMKLPPRHRMGRIWIDSGHAKGIQRGEPAREKIAIDRTFMEAGRDPKAHLERQFLQAVAENRPGG